MPYLCLLFCCESIQNTQQRVLLLIYVKTNLMKGYKTYMYKIFIVFENSLDISNNGEINSLKEYLKHLPSNYKVTITNIGNTNFKAENVEIIPIDSKNKISIIRKAFFSLVFNGCRKNRKLLDIVNYYLNSQRFDHILFLSNLTNRYYKNVNATKINSSLLMTDLPSVAYKNYINNTKKIINKVFYLKELIWCSWYERKITSRYKNIILVNKEEVLKANHEYKTDVFKCIPVVFSYPNDKCVHKTNDNSTEVINLCFIGNMGFRPNKDGIEYFYNKIFKDLPDMYRLHLIGKGSETFFKEDQRVISYGFVEDFGMIMQKMRFGVCFMINGGGMKNKVFDYLKYGVPCVANNYVCENNTVNTEYMFRADNVQEFINTIKQNMNCDSNLVKKSINEYEASKVSYDFWKLF